jgi:signal transduction histidine kinase
MGHQLPRRTVRVRLTLLYGGLFLVSGAALVAITYVLFQRATEYTRPQLPPIPHAPAIRDLRLLGPLANALPQLAFVQHQLVHDQQILGASGPGAGAYTVGPGSKAAASLRGPLNQQLVQAQRQLTQDQRRLARDVDQLAAAVHQMARAGSAEAAQRASDSHELLVNSGIALAIVAVLAVLAGWFISGRMLRPLRTITRTARRISSTSLNERLALDGPQDELKELGDTLDELFGRLDAAFEAQRQFVANASHELRTPLTRQRALIQVALADPEASFSSLRAAHERVLASEQHLEQILDGLLALTRGQAGLERSEHLDLATVSSEAMLARGAQLAGLELHVRATLDRALVEGDARLIERLVANLIDNAIRHNVPAGSVVITTGTRDGHAFLAVSNTGPSVPPEQIERLFQPFQRLSGARTRHDGGHGLGLSIVKAIANAHSAEVSAGARPEGGLVIEVQFPPVIDGESEVTFAAASTKRGRLRRAGATGRAGG